MGKWLTINHAPEFLFQLKKKWLFRKLWDHSVVFSVFIVTSVIAVHTNSVIKKCFGRYGVCLPAAAEAAGF